MGARSARDKLYIRKKILELKRANYKDNEVISYLEKEGYKLSARDLYYHKAAIGNELYQAKAQGKDTAIEMYRDILAGYMEDKNYECQLWLAKTKEAVAGDLTKLDMEERTVIQNELIATHKELLLLQKGIVDNVVIGKAKHGNTNERSKQDAVEQFGESIRATEQANT